VSEDKEIFVPINIELHTAFGDALAQFGTLDRPFRGDVVPNFAALEAYFNYPPITVNVTDVLASSSYGFAKSFNETSITWTGSINITASEYWPYDPNDGLGPIYDSATGEQLRPFPA
jgi:hypothetical protein